MRFSSDCCECNASVNFSLGELFPSENTAHRKSLRAAQKCKGLDQHALQHVSDVEDDSSFDDDSGVTTNFLNSRI